MHDPYAPHEHSWRDTVFVVALCLAPALAALGVVGFFAIAIGRLP